MLDPKTLENLILSKNVIRNPKATTRNELFKEISKLAKKNGYVKDEKIAYDLFIKREEQSSTAFEDNFAIPHAREEKGNSILKPAIIVISSNEGISDWLGMDGLPVKFAFAILMPNDKKNPSSSFYMDVLSTLSSSLLDDNFRHNLKKEENSELLVEIIKDKLLSKEETNSATEVQTISDDLSIFKNKKLVAVTACPVGIAHTYMSAEALEKFCKKNNITIKVEKQGAKGPENVLTKEDIEAADLVIFSVGKAIDKSRFIGKKCHTVSLKEAIHNPKQVILDSEAKGTVLSSVQANNVSSEDKVSIMKHLMAGISYMIPFVITAGILLSIAVGFGSHLVNGKETPRNEFWAAFQLIAVQGLVLMIPVLAGFIANSIGNKAAIAPAMILSFALNIVLDPALSPSFGVDSIIWNWEKMTFGNFDKSYSPAPGFFGAIAIGLLMGYSVKYFNKINFPKFLRPIMPIMIIPILFTFVGWILFAFFLAWPFIGLSIGLSKLITLLNENNLFPVVALLIGFMIAFDMGGPINKVAFLVGTSLIATDHGQTMAFVGVAIGIPPLACGLAYYFSKYILKLNIFDEDDKANGLSAVLLSVVGITEGAIPWAIKFPKIIIIGNIVGSMFGALLLSVLSIISNQHLGNSAAQGGFIVYLVGAVGTITQGGNQTDYLMGLLYVVSIIFGAIVGASLMSFLFKRSHKKEIKHIVIPNTEMSKIEKSRNIFKRHKMVITNNVKKQV